MLNKHTGQRDLYDEMVFERLVPQDHLLVQIATHIDFTFVYEIVKDRYSPVGRGSKDPVIMVKILLLEYLYNLSDVEVTKRIQTDIAFRWFLGLGIEDLVPDDTTISFFRVKRLKETHFEQIFTELVRVCIQKNLIKTRRYIIDSTDVAANVNYPSDKKLLRNAYQKVIKEVMKFDDKLAGEYQKAVEQEIDAVYEQMEKVPAKKHYEITEKYIQQLYVKTHEELKTNMAYGEALSMCETIIDQILTNNKKDAIVSIVDPDARIAHKTRGVLKKGYKNHILVDEDSEIILSSTQTPFNVPDGRKCIELLEKVNDQLGLKSAEFSADRAYGEIKNRAYLKDHGIISNIAFYQESKHENEVFGIKSFTVSADVTSVICPAGATATKYRLRKSNSKTEYKEFNFAASDCKECYLRKQCIKKYMGKKRRLTVAFRYDAVLRDRERIKTAAFQKAYNNRSKVERRFATLVRNHGLRRCRSVRLPRAKIHIILANMACNVVRMVNLLEQPNTT